MSRDPGLLEDILREARLALEFVAGLTKEDFFHDAKTQHAVVRCIEIIGEAANNLSEETYNAVTLPWSEIIGMRHIAIHHYRKLDPERVWNTIHEHVPELVGRIEEFLRDIP